MGGVAAFQVTHQCKSLCLNLTFNVEISHTLPARLELIMTLFQNLKTSLTTCCALAALVFVSSNALAADADVAAALAHPDRPSAEATEDARRKPAEILAFAGLQTGMTVLEMEAGGGYFTEILAWAVGPNGTVIMQNPPAFDSFVGDAPAERSGRVSNIRVSRVNFDDLQEPDASVDMVTWILGPHELGYTPGGVNLGDPAKTFSEIARVLKPGGVLLAVDHIAPADSGLEAGGTLHRIEESLVTQLAADAGLSVLRSSDILKNPDDPLNVGVFDPSIQGKTSQFVVLYRK